MRCILNVSHNTQDFQRTVFTDSLSAHIAPSKYIIIYSKIMRKINPTDVKDAFTAFVVERLDHFDRAENALKKTPHEKRDLSILSETTLHSTYVAFECFLSDLIFAYINRDFSQYQRDLTARISSSVSTKFGAWVNSRTSFNPERHIKVDELEKLLDPDNFNLTFKNVATLKQRCNEWVSAPYKNNIVNLNNPDALLIDTVHAIRNFIAHQSTNSKTLMNQALSTVVTGPTCPNKNLGRGTHDIHDAGAFLKSSFSGNRRVKIYIERLKSIAQSL